LGVWKRYSIVPCSLLCFWVESCWFFRLIDYTQTIFVSIQSFVSLCQTWISQDCNLEDSNLFQFPTYHHLNFTIFYWVFLILDFHVLNFWRNHHWRCWSLYQFPPNRYLLFRTCFFWDYVFSKRINRHNELLPSIWERSFSFTKFGCSDWKEIALNGSRLWMFVSRDSNVVPIHLDSFFLVRLRCSLGCCIKWNLS